jgi:hypothetical protein
MIWLLSAAFLLPPVPGAVTLTTTGQLCVPGYAASIRPPASYTTALKLRQMARWLLPGKPSDYEEDHLVPLSLGGAPRSELNLWPEPEEQARLSDPLETRTHRRLCRGELTLRGARRIVTGWKRRYG